MTYSHYIVLPAFRPEKEFSLLAKDVAILVENAPEGADLTGGKDHASPVINNELLMIGSSRSSDFIPSVLRFSIHEELPKRRYPLLIIDTEGLPYDSVICACIMAIKHHFPSTIITTDGTREDWKMAIALYEYALDRKVPAFEFVNK